MGETDAAIDPDIGTRPPPPGRTGEVSEPVDRCRDGLGKGRDQKGRRKMRAVMLNAVYFAIEPGAAARVANAVIEYYRANLHVLSQAPKPLETITQEVLREARTQGVIPHGDHIAPDQLSGSDGVLAQRNAFSLEVFEPMPRERMICPYHMSQ